MSASNWAVSPEREPLAELVPEDLPDGDGAPCERVAVGELGAPDSVGALGAELEGPVGAVVRDGVRDGKAVGPADPLDGGLPDGPDGSG